MQAESPSHPTAADPSWVAAGTAAGPPLVAVHTWEGETRSYERFAGAADVAVVSMLPPSQADGPLPRRTEQWVDHHHAVLAATPVEPPYRLIGWSFGGVVAVELARRLRAEGKDVSYVGMIDTIRPRLLPLGTREYVWFHLAAAAAMDDDAARRAYLRKRGLFLVHRRFPRTSAATRSVLERLGVRREPERSPSEKPTDPMMVSVHVSYLNYRGDAVPFPVSLYATAASTWRAREPVLRWNGWLHGGFDLTPIAGDHFTLWDEEHVGTLAAAVRGHLARQEQAPIPR